MRIIIKKSFPCGSVLLIICGIKLHYELHNCCGLRLISLKGTFNKESCLHDIWFHEFVLSRSQKKTSTKLNEWFFVCGFQNILLCTPSI